jgi:hypothetical protein
MWAQRYGFFVNGQELHLRKKKPKHQSPKNQSFNSSFNQPCKGGILLRASATRPPKTHTIIIKPRRGVIFLPPNSSTFPLPSQNSHITQPCKGAILLRTSATRPQRHPHIFKPCRGDILQNPTQNGQFLPRKSVTPPNTNLTLSPVRAPSP